MGMEEPDGRLSTAVEPATSPDETTEKQHVFMFTRKHTLHPSLLDSELGRSVPVSELRTLDRLATTVQIDAGDEIMHADDFGRECFVVIDGEFEIQLDDDTITVRSGAVIGELALLTLKRRTASVVATADSSVYVLNRAEFATVLDVCPKLSRHVLDGAVRRAVAA